VRVLITGGTGFIGQHYVQHLARTRPDVRVFFCGRDLEKGRQLAQHTGAHYYRGDLLDLPYTKLICKDIDVVVHMAAMAARWGDYADFYQANVTSTEYLLDAALKNGVARLINLGTSAVYFDYHDHLNVTEDFLPARFANHYARTKFQAEARVLRANSEQLRTLSLRPQMVVGAGDRKLLAPLVRQHRQGQLQQVGGGRNIASMTSMVNLMQGLDCAVFGAEDVCGDVYNLADPQPLNLWDTINQLMPLVNLPTVAGRVTYNRAFLAARLMESLYQLRGSSQPPRRTRYDVALMGNSFSLNIERARQKLGYQPGRAMTDSLGRFADWWNRKAS